MRVWRIQPRGAGLPLLGTYSYDLVSAEVFDTYAFDPSNDLGPSLYCRASYTAGPWVGLVGGNLNDAAYPPAGTAQNGYTPAGFNGGSLLVASGAITDYIGAGIPFEFAFVAKLAQPTSVADSTPVYDCPQLFGDQGGNIGIAVSTGGIRFWMYDNVATIIETAVVPVTWPSYAVIQGGWDGAAIWLSVGGLGPATAATASQNTLSVLRFGVNYDDTKYLTGDVLEVLFCPSTRTSSDRAGYRTYAASRYALSSLRCLVLLNGTLRELPTISPFGQRVILVSGRLTTDVSAGKSLLLDPVTRRRREAATGEVVLTP